MATIRENNGDASADTQTQYIISLGDVFQGTLDPANDKDWIRVELDADIIYDITLSGVEPAQLQLSDSAGYSIVTGGEFPSGAKLIFSPPVSGTYYIHVGSYDDGFTGDYELTLAENTIPLGTYDEIAEFLTDGFREWQGGSRFSFGDIVTANIRELTQDGQQLARWAFEAWTNVTGIEFRFVDEDDADITFDDDVYTGEGGTSITTIVNGTIKSHVNVHTSNLLNHGVTIDSLSFTTYLHEIGHALGLGHPGPYDLAPFYYGYHNIFLIDSMQATLMSYAWQHQNTYIDASYAHPITPMIADIIAIQDLYGVPDNINTGDTIYGYRSNLDGYLGEFFRLWSGEANPFSSVEVASNLEYQALKPVLADLDNDGDTDLVIGNNTGLLYYFENTGTPANPDFTERAGTANPLDGLSVGSYSAPTLIDLDGDSDIDLIVGDGHGNIAYFENTGTATTPGFTQRSGAANPFDGITMGTRSTLALVDLDSDGDQDLAVGTNDGEVLYHENTGTPSNPDFVLRTGAANPFNEVKAGAYNSPAFIDADNDHDFDLVVGSNNGDILYHENTGTTTEPVFVHRAGFDNPFHATVAGYWIGLEFADLNDDGHPDLIVGNEDGIIHYFENTSTQESPEFSPQSLASPTTFTIYDNGGTDTLDVRTDTNDQRINLRPEGISDVYGLNGNVIIARDTWIENFIAGSGNDIVAGNAVANYINGRDGDDRLWGSGGDDILEGGAGADRLDGDAGMDWASYQGSNAAVTVNLAGGTVTGGHAEGDVLTEIENVIGSDYEDVLTGNDDANRLDGGAGADQLDGGGGSDWVSYQWSDAGVTVDLAEGTFEGGHAQGDVVSNIENVTGSDHADVLWGDGNVNRLEGGLGDDELSGAGGADVLDGGGGDDLLYGSPGADQLNGGAGYDVLTYQLSGAGITINLEEGTLTGGYAQGDVFTGIERIAGSDHRDVLTGDNRSNELHGMAGADELRGNDGDDKLEGGADADELDGGTGVDWLLYLESDAGVTVNLGDSTASGGHAQGDTITGFENIAGSDHDDVLTGDDDANRLEGSGGADRLNGGAGVDWASYFGSDAAVTVNLSDNTASGGHAQGDALTNIENIAGSLYQDVLTGDGNANELFGYEGNDTLQGNGGDDVLEGGMGADQLHGGSGADTASYRSSYAAVKVNLQAGTLEGGHAAGDVLTGIENIAGSDFHDVLVGDDEANRLTGIKGDDKLKGGIGNDRLFGNLGNDWLYGGEGDDALRGNEGDDRLFGEAGADEMDGGNGIDWVSYQESGAGVTVNLMNGTGEGGHAQDDDIANVENVVGSGYADVLTGDGLGNILRGLGGDDELRGNGGNDVLEGGAGADDLNGGAGVDAVSYRDSDEGVSVDLAAGTGEGGHAEGDVLTGIENVVGSSYEDAIRGDNGTNRLIGGAGDDRLHGGAGADLLDGGKGTDLIEYWASDAGVVVNLKEGTAEGGHAQGDVIVGIERVWGSRYGDVLVGDDGNNLLDGYHGEDDLQGGGGDDWINGSPGADKLDGGEGSDVVSYWHSDTGVTVNLEDGTGQGGYAEGDVIVDVENIQGSNYRDVLTGGDNDNYLDGLDGNDELRGNSGDDWLIGNEGDDTFIFGAGHGDDIIGDFTNNEDQIDLRAFSLSGFDDLTITSEANGAKIDLTEHGGGTIFLQEFDMNNLDATDFLF